MTTEHTPGPWIAVDEDADTWKIQSDDWGTITQLHRAAGMSDVQPDAEMEATARLIAAAPELLEASQRALNTITRWHVRGKPTDFSDTLDVLGDAIAKATGGTQ